MVVKIGRNGEFIACSGYPKCRYTKSLLKSDKPMPNVLEGIKCPKCDGDIIERSSKRGKFFGCSNYPKCSFISSNKPTNKKCVNCNSMMVFKENKTRKYYQCISCKYKEEMDV